MARTANSMVTFQDLDDMVTFDGFSYVTNPITPPSNLNTCATKLDVLGYLNVTLNRSIANNQLVSYSIIVSSINTTAFIIEVDTTNSGSSNANQFQFTGAEGDYDVVAKQSGTTVATFNNLSNEETITLPSNGNYILEVTPKETNGFNKIRFNNGGDKLKITDIKQWGSIVWSSFNSAFYGCSNMVVNATDAPNLSSVTNMSFMFFNANSFNQNINNWDVSNVTNMSFMFYDTNSFNQPLNNWDVSNVTDMNTMFYATTLFNQPLDNWDVSSVSNMDAMFSETSSFNQPLNNWDVSSVTSMGAMFEDAESFNRDLSSWCVSNITSEPSDFDTRASDWILPNSRPVWGTCPGTDTNDFEISLDRVEYFNTNGKDYIFQRSDELFLSTPDFGNIVIVGTVRFEEIGAVSEPYTGNCEVLRTQDVSFSYDLSYPYDDDITVYVNSINPYSTTPNSGGCNTVDRLGSIKVNFDSFTNTPIISGNNKLTINNQVRDR